MHANFNPRRSLASQVDAAVHADMIDTLSEAMDRDILTLRALCQVADQLKRIGDLLATESKARQKVDHA